MALVHHKLITGLASDITSHLRLRLCSVQGLDSKNPPVTKSFRMFHMEHAESAISSVKSLLEEICYIEPLQQGITWLEDGQEEFRPLEPE